VKRYAFRLASVLRVRRVQEDLAKADLVAANVRVLDARAVLEERIDHYDSLLEEEDGLGAVSLEVALARRQRLNLAAAGVVRAVQSRHAAETRAEEARVRYLDAARAVSVLERLDQRRREEHRVEVDREETRAVDDLVVGRYGRGAA